MIPHNHLVIGGIVSIIISFVGSVFNIFTLYVLLSVKTLRNNSTSILIIFLLFSNLIYTLLILPLNSLALLKPDYFMNHLHQCSIFAFLYYWNFASLLFLQAALAFNRCVTVCTTRFRFNIRASLTAGTISLVSSTLILISPAFLHGWWDQFGWDEGSGTCTTRLDRTVLYSLCILLPYVIIAVSYVGIIIHVRQSRRRLRSSLQISTNRNNQSAYELPDQGDLKEQSQSSVDELEKHKKNKDLVERSKEKNMTIVIGIILVSYLTCTIPGAVIIQLDPAAFRYRYAHIPTYILTWVTGLIIPLVYGLGSTTYRAVAMKQLGLGEI